LGIHFHRVATTPLYAETYLQLGLGSSKGHADPTPMCRELLRRDEAYFAGFCVTALGADGSTSDSALIFMFDEGLVDMFLAELTHHALNKHGVTSLHHTRTKPRPKKSCPGAFITSLSFAWGKPSTRLVCIFLTHHLAGELRKEGAKPGFGRKDVPVAECALKYGRATAADKADAQFVVDYYEQKLWHANYAPPPGLKEG